MGRRNGYYAPPRALPPAPAATAPDDDVVWGEEAIAETLQLKDTAVLLKLIAKYRGRPNRLPIRKLAGGVLMARQQELLAWRQRIAEAAKFA